MKRLLTLFLAFISILTICSCKGEKLKIKGIRLIHEEEFGGIYIKKTIEEFNNVGYEYGDSVNIYFSNGKKLKDIPYYNGYYVDANNELLVAYPGYDYIKAAINFGDDLWELLDIDENDTATITLNAKAKYKDIQLASDITYYDDKTLYETDEIFSNFREIRVGNIKEGILYRSASPCDNTRKRASTTDSLMERENIKFIMNLADTDAKIEKYIAKDDFNSPYFLSLYQNNKCYVAPLVEEKDLLTSSNSIIPLAMNMNYRSEDFAKKVAAGFKATLNAEGAILIHCQEGKDRTGFVCIVIEALMGATYKEIVDDYMITYANYYGIDKNDSRYETIKARNVDSMLDFITDGNDYKTVNLVNYAKEYLKFGGMSDSEINQLIEMLSK